MPHRPNTLDLVGDGDELDLILDIERAFDVRFTDGELEQVATVGDLQRLVVEKVPAGGRTTACHSQIAFHRIRAAARRAGVAATIRPASPVGALFPAARDRRELRRAWTDLERSSALRFPDWAPPRAGDAAASGRRLSLPVGLAVQAMLVLGFVAFWPMSILVLALGAGIAIFRWSRTTIAPRIATVGDLAREAAAASFESLRDERGSFHPNDLPRAVTALCRAASGATGVVDADTTLCAGAGAQRRSA